MGASSEEVFQRAPADIEAAMARRSTVMGDFLVDAEALLAAHLDRGSLDDIAHQAQPPPSTTRSPSP